MNVLKKIKLGKSCLKITNELYVIETVTKLHYCSVEATMFLL